MRLDYSKASPGGVKAFGSVYGYIHAVRAGCPSGGYCLDMHTRDLVTKGVSVGKLALVQVWHEAGALFSEREQAALAWAESVTRVSDTHVPDDTFHAAAAVFSEKELADLTMAISLMNAFNRLAISFRRPPEVQE